MTFLKALILLLPLGFAIPVFAGLDPIRPACARDCVRDGGDPQVCYVTCFYCNVHNSYCPQIRSFCGYVGTRRIGWMLDLTRMEATVIDSTAGMPNPAEFLRISPMAPGTSFYRVIRTDRATNRPLGAPIVLQQLGLETLIGGGMTYTTKACLPN